MILTKDFIVAVEAGISALHTNSGSLKQSELFNNQDQVGEILRIASEQATQQAELLSGWTKRARKEIGMETLRGGGE